MRKLFLILVAVMACSLGVMAQSRTIHGTVLDAATNEPLIGATVMPIGGGQGTATDIDGNFVLTVPQKVKKANVSYVGYKSKEVELANGMKVYLESTSTSLDDVVVVAYGTANKESLTGSVSVVGSKEIEDRPVTSVTAALEGNSPGVQVNNTTGTPGSAPDILIRGFNSINGSNSPLYVVDGVIFNGSISDLNPQDIESMSVLKDAASAALYGAKGANGVILISTKKAKNTGKVDVTLNISQGTYSYGLPRYKTMEANQWMQTCFDGFVTSQVAVGAFDNYEASLAAARESFITSYALNNVYGVANDQLFDENGKFVGGNVLPGYTDLDWWDSISRTGYRQEYNVNAAAATEKFNVFTSVGYLNEKGYTIKTDFERYTARINTNSNPTSYLKFGVNLAGSQTEMMSNPNAGDDSVENPFGVFNVAPIYPYYAHDLDGNIIYDNGKPKWNTAGYLQSSNPGYTMRLNDQNNTATVIDANVYGTIVLPYGFEATVRGTMHRDKTLYWEYGNNTWGSYKPANGSFSNYTYDTRNHQFMQMINWSKEYGANHVDVMLDHENYEYYEKYYAMMNSDQIFNGVMDISNFSLNAYTGGGQGMIRSERYLGRVRYNYDQKYFLEGSFTREGSSRFSKNNRWGSFWSAGLSWIISKEKFLHNVTWIDYLKFRASYGSVGNDATAGAYAYWSLYGYSIEYGQGTGNTPLVPVQFAANNVKWEATKTFDVGIDASLFNDRLSLSMGYFDKRNSDLLMNVYQPLSSGSLGFSGATPSVLNNIGTMSNRGFELSATGTLLRNKDMEWTVSADLTWLKNKIVKLPEGRDIIGSPFIKTEGKSIYEFYLEKWAGVDQLTGKSLYEMDSHAHEYKLSDGTYDAEAYAQDLADAAKEGSLVVINGKNYTTNTNYAKRQLLGSPLPTVYGSFGTNFSWKGLNVGLLFTYSLGGKVLDSRYQGFMSYGDSPSALHVDLANAWKAAPEGMTADSPDRIDPNGIPQLNSADNLNNNGSSSRWFTSRNYLVFKNLNVSYDLPKKWTSPLQLQGLNIGVSADNLFSCTARKGMNPQQSWAGTQSAYYGTARVFTFQLTARF